MKFIAYTTGLLFGIPVAVSILLMAWVTAIWWIEYVF
jgi:hypothetical protein